jgi:hypothetical protein
LVFENGPLGPLDHVMNPSREVKRRPGSIVTSVPIEPACWAHGGAYLRTRLHE